MISTEIVLAGGVVLVKVLQLEASTMGALQGGACISNVKYSFDFSSFKSVSISA